MKRRESGDQPPRSPARRSRKPPPALPVRALPRRRAAAQATQPGKQPGATAKTSGWAIGASARTRVGAGVPL